MINVPGSARRGEIPDDGAAVAAAAAAAVAAGSRIFLTLEEKPGGQLISPGFSTNCRSSSRRKRVSRVTISLDIPALALLARAGRRGCREPDTGSSFLVVKLKAVFFDWLRVDFSRK